MSGYPPPRDSNNSPYPPPQGYPPHQQGGQQGYPPPSGPPPQGGFEPGAGGFGFGGPQQGGYGGPQGYPSYPPQGGQGYPPQGGQGYPPPSGYPPAGSGSGYPPPHEGQTTGDGDRGKLTTAAAVGLGGAALYGMHNQFSNVGNQQHQPPAYSPGPPQGYQAGGGGGGPERINRYTKILQDCVIDQGLQFFYPDGRKVRDIAAALDRSDAVGQIKNRWDAVFRTNANPQTLENLIILALFDTVIYADDSGSMTLTADGHRVKNPGDKSRKDELKEKLAEMAYVISLFDDDGMTVRFINANLPPGVGDNVRTADQVISLLGHPSIEWKYQTPLGERLRQKVLMPNLDRAKRGQLQKPLLIITLTDGDPHPEPDSVIRDVIKESKKEFNRLPCKEDAVSFMFAQIGEDQQARKFLNDLDNDRHVGHMIDVVSSYEASFSVSHACQPLGVSPIPIPIHFSPLLTPACTLKTKYLTDSKTLIQQAERVEVLQTTGQHLTLEGWLMKLMLGAISTSMDWRDEGDKKKLEQKRSAAGGGHGGKKPFGGLFGR